MNVRGNAIGLIRLLRTDWLRVLWIVGLTMLSAWVAAQPPMLARRIIDEALPAGSSALLLASAALLALAMIAREALRLIHEYMAAALGLRLTGRIRRELWQRLLHAPLQFFVQTQRGEILQRLIADAEVVQGAAIQSWPRLLYETAVALAAAVAMLRMNPPVAAMAIGLVLLAVAPGQAVGRFSRRLGSETRQLQVAMMQQAQERLEAIRLVKGFTAEEREAEQFRMNQLAWSRAELRAILLGQAYMNLPRILDSLAPMLVRAFLRRPQLLLLDEATAALDNENQALVQASIEALSRSCTIITVAHRLSTIANADLIIALNEGRAVEVRR